MLLSFSLRSELISDNLFYMEQSDHSEIELNKKETKTKEEVAEERKQRKLAEAAAKAEKKRKDEEKKTEVKVEPKKEDKKKKLVEVYQSSAKIVRPTIGQPVYVKEGEKNILITSALPYVNNEPHLGNIIGCVLSADVFARYSRLRGNNTLYICGTDEYGTATETKALKDGITPRELCDKYFALHKEIYEWFDIDFDIFGRTPTEVHTKITIDIFRKLQQHENIVKKQVKQLKCLQCKSFLADRYVVGTCYYPGCLYHDAGGDQCDKCGNLTVPIELISPRCKMCGSKPEVCESYHYYVDLPKIEPQLKEWLNIASNEWSSNSTHLAKGFLHEGLIQRCITRDLKWGVNVPNDGDEDMKDKVFYVWFDAPIGYLSITANLVEDWEQWWKNPENVKLYQFMGKDNVTFHSIMFPSCLIGTGEKYTLVNNLSTTEYLTYEGNKFSKSNEIGVFGSQAKDTGIPSEVWRYYLLSIRPENGDTDFFWDRFAEKVNNELLNNLGNLCNRVFSFINSKFDQTIPQIEVDDELAKEDIEHIAQIEELFNTYVTLLDKVKLKEGLEVVMKISSEGNSYLNKTEPWNVLKSDKKRAGVIQNILVSTIRLVTSLIEPYLPSFSAKIFEIMNITYSEAESKQIYNLIGDFKKNFSSIANGGGKLRPCTPIFGESKL